VRDSARRRLGKRGRGAQGRNRTTDTVIFSHVLYQLSYLGAVPDGRGLIAKKHDPVQRRSRSLRLGVVLRGLVGVVGRPYSVVLLQPSPEVDDRAPPRAERPVLRDRRLAANGAASRRSGVFRHNPVGSLRGRRCRRFPGPKRGRRRPRSGGRDGTRARAAPSGRAPPRPRRSRD
jgi:hypothetical protein